MDGRQLLDKLRADLARVNFRNGERFTWSPKDQSVIYDDSLIDQPQGIWSLLHEAGHALLDHANYSSDFELVKLEAAAWQQASLLARKYSVKIDGDHIQDCLDTYRDWLHQRSSCPSCGNTSLQSNMNTYCCYNCNTQWRVSRAKLCRPYRRLQTSSAN